MGVIYLNGIPYGTGGGGQGQTIQVESLPAASATEVDHIYQYIGSTTATYNNGYFYKCIYKDNDYTWEQVNVQPGGSGGGSSYADLSNKPTINGVIVSGDMDTADLDLVDNSTLSVDTNNKITIKNPPSLDGNVLILTF